MADMPSMAQALQSGGMQPGAMPQQSGGPEQKIAEAIMVLSQFAPWALAPNVMGGGGESPQVAPGQAPSGMAY